MHITLGRKTFKRSRNDWIHDMSENAVPVDGWGPVTDPTLIAALNVIEAYYDECGWQAW